MNNKDTDPIEDLNIRHLKLSSGEEVIGLIAGVDVKKQLVHIERPVSLSSAYEDDYERFYLLDWMPISKTNITAISSQHIIAQTEVNTDMKENYIRFVTNSANREYEYNDEALTDKDTKSDKTFH